MNNNNRWMLTKAMRRKLVRVRKRKARKNEQKQKNRKQIYKLKLI